MTERPYGRIVSVACAITVAYSLATAASVQALQTVATSGGISGQQFSAAPYVDTCGGVTVWSEEVNGLGGPETDRYFLTASVGGARVRLPIAPRLGCPLTWISVPTPRAG